MNNNWQAQQNYTPLNQNSYMNNTPMYNSAPDYMNYNAYNNIDSEPGLYASDRIYGQFSTGGELHDTFRIDRYDNVYGGHTTLNMGKDIGNVHMGW